MSAIRIGDVRALLIRRAAEALLSDEPLTAAAIREIREVAELKEERRSPYDPAPDGSRLGRLKAAFDGDRQAADELIQRDAEARANVKRVAMPFDVPPLADGEVYQ